MSKKELNGYSFIKEDPYKLENEALEFIHILEKIDQDSEWDESILSIRDAVVFMLENVEWVVEDEDEDED